MTSASTIKTLIFTLGPTLGPLLLPRLLSWYRAQRAKADTAPLPKQPVPKPVKSSLNLIFLSAAVALISTLPYFAPENIFTLTSSRLQTPNDVLFTRLSILLGMDSDALADIATLKPKLASMDSRLLYFTYGPDVVTHCPFCVSDQPMSYFYYALPSILLPHLLHALVLGLATSSGVSDKYGVRWRSFATWLSIALCCGECLLFTTYDWKANARATRPEEYVHFYWQMRVARGVGIALFDLLFACFLYLSATNRFFVVPINPAERLETALRTLDGARGKLNALGIMRNVEVRDDGLRRKSENYWLREGQIMGEVMDEKEVVEGVRNALSGRIQVSKVEEEAKRYADGITTWPPVHQHEPSE